MNRVPSLLLIAFLSYLTVSRSQSPCANSTIPLSLIEPEIPEPPEVTPGSSTLIIDVFYNCISHSIYPMNISYTVMSVVYRSDMSSSQFYIQLAFKCVNQMWSFDATRSQFEGKIVTTAPIPNVLSHDFIREDCHACMAILSPNDSVCMECNESCPGVNTTLGYCYGAADNECCPYSYNNKCVNNCPGLSLLDSTYTCVCNANCLNSGFLNNSCGCECAADFYGDLCENQHLPCVASNPCVNGSCIDGIGPNNLTCDCKLGFAGVNCEVNIDDCPGNRCAPGVCMDGVNRYSCVCPSGYRVVGNLLPNPQCALDHCFVKPCMNGGTCNNTLGGYTCTCMSLFTGVNCTECVNSYCGNGTLVNCGCVCYAGHSGTFCETDIDDCNPDPCLNAGICLDGNGTFTCDCSNTGYEGDRCHILTDNCQPDPCMNGGTCNNNVGSYSCQCSSLFTGVNCTECVSTNCVDGTLVNCGCICFSGHTGRFCEMSIDDCDPNPCLNGGNCMDGNGTFTCNCSNTGFEGVRCENMINNCQPDPCMNGGNCTSSLGGYSCACNSLFTGVNCTECVNYYCGNGTLVNCGCVCYAGHSGTFCETDIDNCNPDPCLNGGSCLDGNGTFICDCSNTGFEGDRCQILTDNCQPDPCMNGGICNNTVGSYSCACSSLFTGVNCTECVSTNCVDGILVDCGCNCYTGYTGRFCETDIDDCNPNPCQNGGICMDGNGTFTCDCSSTGFEGAICDQLTDNCFPNPCVNNGICTSSVGSYSCACASRYTGVNCSECVNTDCRNGTLVDCGCVCYSGHTGTSCETDIDECNPDPCENGGICRDGNGTFVCDCFNTGFEGDRCQILTDNCQPDPCMNGGNCTSSVGGYSCACSSLFTGVNCTECVSTNCVDGILVNCGCECYVGYTGRFCDMDIDDCNPNSCLNGGICLDGNGTFTCDCSNTGFEGDRCQILTDNCQTDLCMNGGNCTSNLGGYSCTCSNLFTGVNCTECVSTNCVDGTLVNCGCICFSGHTGQFCERDIDDCNPNPCQNAGNCLDGNGTFTCDCSSTGFEGDRCHILTDNCQPDPCMNGGTCNNNVGSYSCDCSNLFTGVNCTECVSTNCVDGTLVNCGCECYAGHTGQFCDMSIDDCNPNPCLNGGSCLDGNGTFTCNCSNTGFEGDICRDDLDECLNFPCQNSGTCVNTQGGYNCQCQSGFNGSNCESDINECLHVRCQDQGLCVNSVGSFNCDCYFGFNGSMCENVTVSCEDFNCQNGGTCNQTLTDIFCTCESNFTGSSCESVICPDGYEYNGTTCQNINECSRYFGICGDFPTLCTDSDPLYTCSCPTGYRLDGAELPTLINYCDNSLCAVKYCVDVNECELNTHNCHPTQICENINGSYICICGTDLLQSLGVCVEPVFQPDCPETSDANGHVWPGTFKNSLVNLRCANSDHAIATRPCYPACICSGESAYWGKPRIRDCVSAELQVLRDELQAVSSDSKLSAARFKNVLESIRIYTTSVEVKGQDLQVLTNLLGEIIRTFEQLLITEWEVSLFIDVVNISNALLATDPDVWKELGNVTENILSIHDSILKVSELISEFIYSNDSMNELNIAAPFIELNIVKWEQFSSNIDLYNLYTPSPNFSLQIQNIKLKELNLGIRETPESCHVYVTRLFLPTFNSLIAVQEVQEHTCVQTPTRSLVYPIGLFSFGVHTSKCHIPLITLPYPTNFFRVRLTSLTFQISEVSYQLRSVTNYSEFSKFDSFPDSNCAGPFIELGDLLYYCHTVEDFILTLSIPDDVPFYASPFGISFRIFVPLSSILSIISLFLIARGYIVLIDGAVFVRINVITTIISSQLILAIGIDRTESETVCIVVRFLIHYIAIATCVWGFIDAINICVIIFFKSYRVVFNIVYVILGYLLPLIPVGISVSISSCPYFRNSTFCWPSNQSSLEAVWYFMTPFYLMLLAFVVLIIIEIVIIIYKRGKIVIDFTNEPNLLVRMLISSFALPFFLILWWIVTLYAFGSDNPSFILQILCLVMSCVIGTYVLLVYTIFSHTTSIRKEEKPTQVTHFGMEGFQSNPIFRDNEIELKSDLHTGITFLSDLDTFF